MKKAVIKKESLLTKPGAMVNSVGKALRILECFTEKQPELTLSQISLRLGFPKSTTLNLIRTLEINGYLVYLEDKQTYQLGYKILGLSYILRSSMSMIHKAIPLLEELQIKTGENIYLTSHVDGQVLFLEALYPSVRIGNYSIVGKFLPMHCTSCGKAMMAYLPEKEIDQILECWGLPAFTQNTITTRERLDAELETIRKRGYAIDVEEESLGIKCIGMAIRDTTGYPTGAVSISGTVMNMSDNLIEDYAKMISRVCSVLSVYAHQFPAAQLQCRRSLV